MPQRRAAGTEVSWRKYKLVWFFITKYVLVYVFETSNNWQIIKTNWTEPLITLHSLWLWLINRPNNNKRPYSLAQGIKPYIRIITLLCSIKLKRNVNDKHKMCYQILYHYIIFKRHSENMLLGRLISCEEIDSEPDSLSWIKQDILCSVYQDRLVEKFCDSVAVIRGESFTMNNFVI